MYFKVQSEVVPVVEVVPEPLSAGQVYPKLSSWWLHKKKVAVTRVAGILKDPPRLISAASGIVRWSR